MSNDFEKQNMDLENSSDNIGGDVNDSEIVKDIKEGEGEDKEIGKDGQQEDQIQEQADTKEEKDTDKEGEAAQSQEKGDSSQGQAASSKGSAGTKSYYGNVLDGQRYSSSYTPPYYAPNVSVVSEKKDKKSGRGVGIGFVALLCVVCAVIAASVGAYIGSKSGGGLTNDESSLTILKGNKDVVVTDVPDDSTYSNLTVPQIAALVGESVVEITTTHVQTNTFFGQYITSGAGSGVIFTQDTNVGYIVTNYHVIDGANEINVRVKDGESYTDYAAQYIGGAAAEDIAVLKITKKSGETFVVAQFADSDKLCVGEQVVAIGNPLGQLGGTVTDGIISALDREITIEDNTMVLLQTNAAINPGNSGGGLFDTSGLLVGIVNAKQSSAGIEGLGFAIPSNNVLSNIYDILDKGYITGRPTLGITVQEGTYVGDTVVYVSKTTNSQFKQYDFIYKIADTEITSLSDYNIALKKLTIGDTVSVTVVRNNSYVTLDVKVTENKSTS